MKKLIPALLLLLTVVLYSCDKEEETGDVSLVTARDNMKIEIMLNDAFEVMTYFIRQEAPFSGVRYPCMDSVTTETAGELETYHIHFGSDQCEDEDERSRKGKLSFTFNGSITEEGTIITITPDNYMLNDYELQGEVTVTNEGANSEGNIEFEISAPATTIVAPLNDYTVQCQSVHTRTWTNGAQSNFVEDDEYLINGSGNGLDRTEKSFTFAIDEALSTNIICNHFQSGVTNVTPSGALTRRIDYGDGSCDDQAKITVNNRDYSIDIE